MMAEAFFWRSLSASPAPPSPLTPSFVFTGQYEEIATEKDFFNTMKGEERMICHFYRENWPCKVRGAMQACILAYSIDFSSLNCDVQCLLYM